jgi:inhibitor of KinA sporulation pathway (predicted exonuclease)
MSRMHYGKVIVIDLEGSCWDKEHGEQVPEGEEHEIIEIGVALLNMSTGNIDKSESYIIKPVKSKISKFCTELTTLTQEQVDKGMTFERAIKLLKRDFGSKNTVWASYGDYDRKQIKLQCEQSGIEYPFNHQHLNVKTLFTLRYKLNRAIGMAKALDMLNMKLEGTHHRGVDDAINTAKLLWQVLK